MTIQFSCPGCQQQLQAPDGKEGAKVQCPGCSNVFQVPYAPITAVEVPVAVVEIERGTSRREGEPRIDLAMLAVLDALIEDPIVFRWARQQLHGDELKVHQFQRVYLGKKKQKSTAHLLNLVSLVGIGGLHRFYLGDTALGVGHLLTAGFCWVGTVIDIFAINQRVNQANFKIALQSLEIARVM